MITMAVFFLWVAFRIQFLNRGPFALGTVLRSRGSSHRFDAFALYYLACAVAAIYFSVLFYWESSHGAKIIVIPAICAALTLWRKLLIHGPRRST